MTEVELSFLGIYFLIGVSALARGFFGTITEVSFFTVSESATTCADKVELKKKETIKRRKIFVTR